MQEEVTGSAVMQETVTGALSCRKQSIGSCERGGPGFWIQLWIQLCNQVKWEVRKAVKHYEEKVAQNSKKNPKAFYKYVKSKTHVKTGVPELTYDGKTATTDCDKAEVLNQFYTSVFTKEDDNIPTPTQTFTDSILSDIVITEKMVEKKLDNLNQNKSPGNDNHHPRVLIEVKDQTR